MIFPFIGIKCEHVGGRADDSGGHGRPRDLHPRQWVSVDEGTCPAQLEQPDLYSVPWRSRAQLRVCQFALPRWVTEFCRHIDYFELCKKHNVDQDYSSRLLVRIPSVFNTITNGRSYSEQWLWFISRKMHQHSSCHMLTMEIMYHKLSSLSLACFDADLPHARQYVFITTITQITQKLHAPSIWDGGGNWWTKY